MDNFILFEFVDGQTLSAYLEENDRNKDKAIITRLENIAKTLIQANIIHRDIHERNIIVTQNSIKLIDLQMAILLLKPEPSILGSTCSYYDDMYSINLIINKLGGKSEFVMSNIGNYKVRRPIIIQANPDEAIKIIFVIYLELPYRKF